jgi:hypothetical protein
MQGGAVSWCVAMVQDSSSLLNRRVLQLTIQPGTPLARSPAWPSGLASASLRGSTAAPQLQGHDGQCMGMVSRSVRCT